MKRLIFLCLGFCAALSAQPSSDYEQGCAAFQSGDFQKAAGYYESAIHAGYQAFELYYNLGNCYYKLNQTGKCLLYYEKAKKLNPSDPDVLYNLDLAQLRVVDKMITPPEFFWDKIWKGIKSLASIDQLAGVMVLLLFLAVLATIGKLFVDKEPWRMFISYVWSPLAILVVVVGLYFTLRVNQAGHEKEGIIMVEKVSVSSSPSNSGTEVFALHEGSKVRVAERSAGYVRISLPDGKVGWLPASSLQEI